MFTVCVCVCMCVWDTCGEVCLYCMCVCVVGPIRLVSCVCVYVRTRVCILCVSPLHKTAALPQLTWKI